MKSQTNTRDICIHIYPEEYRKRAEILQFRQLPIEIAKKIHQHRNIKDIYVSRSDIYSLLGFGESSFQDLVLHRISKKPDLISAFAYCRDVVPETPTLKMALFFAYHHGHIHPYFRNCRRVVLLAAQRIPWYHDHFTNQMHDKFLDDEEIMLAVLERYKSFDGMSPRLKADRNFQLKAIQISYLAFGVFDLKARSNSEIAKAAVIREPYNLRYLDDNLRANDEIVKAALSRNGDSLRFANHKYLNNREMILVAVKSSGK